jgi:Ulp1 family protease
MNQERILELIAETAALTLTPLKKEELKQNDTTINVTLDMTMGCLNKQMVDESVISTKNDPDVIKIARCKFDINKTYIEVVAKFVANKGAADEVVIRNDEANYFVTRGSIERLRPGKWLNDEIINAYIRLINLRKSMKGYALNTFFYTMLENMKLN